MKYHYDFDDEDQRFFEQLKKELFEEQLGEIMSDKTETDELVEHQEKFNSIALGYAALVHNIGDVLQTLDEREQTRVFHELEAWNAQLTHLNESKHEIFKKISMGHGLQQAFRLSNETVGVFYQTAKYIVAQENYRDASNLFALLADLAPHISEFWIGMGICLHALGEHDKAARSYLHAASVAPQDPLPDLLAAECYILIDQKEKARDLILGAKKKNKDHSKNETLSHQIEELESKLH